MVIASRLLGTLWLGAWMAFGRDPRSGTLVVLHARDYQDPWHSTSAD